MEEEINYNWKPAKDLLDHLDELDSNGNDLVVELPFGTYMKFRYYTNDRSQYVEIINSEEPLEGELIITSVCYKRIDGKLVIESYNEFVCELEFIDKMEYTLLVN